MTDLHEIHVIPVDAITVLNPRERNPRVFNELVTSIAHLGLKKPITVSQRQDQEGYDLVCGQGRLEAFIALGEREIPAIVIEASQEDRYMMSLVENLARRNPRSLELMREIGSLKNRGYNNAEIAGKIDFSPDYVGAICFLLEHGENRLLVAVERGLMPPNIAIEIARAPEAEVQQALADAYEAKALPGKQILAIRRIIQQRNQMGKGGSGSSGRAGSGAKVTAASLVQSYQKEAEHQKLLVKKADLTQSRLLFIVNALRRLFGDDDFVSLLRAEGMHTLPRPLAAQLELVEA
jgi:ParB family chromosome partitioning protein